MPVRLTPWRTPREPSWTPESLVWGVPRREGYSDTNDIAAHKGLTQHAFEPGRDERAICGFEPPKRPSPVSAVPYPQIAVPSDELNPRCPKCVRLVEHRRHRLSEQRAAAERSSSAADVGAVSSAATEPGTDDQAAWPEEDLAEGPGFDEELSGEAAAAAGPDGANATDPDEAADGSLEAAFGAAVEEDSVETGPDDSAAPEAVAPATPGSEPSRSRPPRRSVRKSGTVIVPAGQTSVLIEIPAELLGAAIVATTPDGHARHVVRIEADDSGLAEFTLDGRSDEPVQVTWYAVTGLRGVPSHREVAPEKEILPPESE